MFMTSTLVKREPDLQHHPVAVLWLSHTASTPHTISASLICVTSR